MRSLIFIDTSGFKALIDQNDDFHLFSKQIFDSLKQANVQLVTSNLIIAETVTLLRYRTGKASCFIFKDFIAEGGKDIKVMRATSVDEAEAWTWMEKDWSRLSFTDCVSFAQLKRLEINRVFGFDHHFEQAGFILEK